MYGEAGKHWNTWLPPKVKIVVKLTNNQLNKQEIFAGCEDSGAWRYQIVWRLKRIILLCIFLKIFNKNLILSEPCTTGYYKIDLAGRKLQLIALNTAL